MVTRVGLGLLVVASFLLRVIPQWDQVSTPLGVMYRGADPWYHMRMADFTFASFPRVIGFDPYALYPGGADVGMFPLISWTTAFLGKVGFNLEAVGALLPPIVGSLTLIPCYFLGKRVFGKPTAIIGCILISILPCEFLHRSLLGFTDQHVMEAFLMVTTILFTLKAFDTSRKWVIPAGLFLGLFYLNWHGGILLLAILFFGFLIKFGIDVSKNRLSREYCLKFSLILLTGSVIGVSYLFTRHAESFRLMALCIVPIIPMTLYEMYSHTKRKRGKVVLTSILGTLFVLALLVPWTPFNYIVFYYHFRSVFWGFGAPIGEASPMDLMTAFSFFGSIIALVIPGMFFAIKDKKPYLILVWMFIVIIATIGQRRWSYYSVVPISFLGAYTLEIIVRKFNRNVRSTILVIATIFILIVSARGTLQIATMPSNITSDWYRALVWLRENSDDPLANSMGSYYRQTSAPPEYGVLTWWDYGHWITRIAHRVPCSSPAFQDQMICPKVLMSSSEEEALEIIGDLDIRYIIVDINMLSIIYNPIMEKAGEHKPVRETFMYQLWMGNTDTYKLSLHRGTVKIFRRQ